MLMDMKTGKRRDADILQQHEFAEYVLVNRRKSQIHETAGDDCYLAIHEPSIDRER